MADPDTDTVILTGGWGALTRAWRYGTKGMEAELPSLGVGRFWFWVCRIQGGSGV